MFICSHEQGPVNQGEALGEEQGVPGHGGPQRGPSNLTEEAPGRRREGVW